MLKGGGDEAVQGDDEALNGSGKALNVRWGGVGEHFIQSTRGPGALTFVNSIAKNQL